MTNEAPTGVAMNQPEIVDVSVYSASSYGKTRWFEGTVTIDEGGPFKRFSMEFPISDLTEIGVCTTLRIFKKVNEWANTDAGHAYIIANRNRESMMTRLRITKV